MLNQRKIITMTKLALYDKHDGPADRDASNYFRHDYIYKKNLGTRLAVGLGSVFILIIYWLRLILIDGIDVLEVNMQEELTSSILFILVMLAVYSVIGTVQGTREYYVIQKRLQEYQQHLQRLEKLDERNIQAEAEEEEPEEARPRRRVIEEDTSQRRRNRAEGYYQRQPQYDEPTPRRQANQDTNYRRETRPPASDCSTRRERPASEETPYKRTFQSNYDTSFRRRITLNEPSTKLPELEGDSSPRHHSGLDGSTRPRRTSLYDAPPETENTDNQQDSE
ncbi:MAG: hypothetical protein FWC78_01350 [Defluviitaleaceae bacterium]|nr:hypothetical protein [Defluviitaleaceae bacterium]